MLNPRALAVEPIFEASLAAAYAADWAAEHDYEFAALKLNKEDLGDMIEEEGPKMVAVGVLIVVAQHVPYLNVAVDIGLVAMAIHDALHQIDVILEAEREIRSAETVVDLQRAAANRNLKDTRAGAMIVLDALGAKQGMKSARKNIKNIREKIKIRKELGGVASANEFRNFIPKHRYVNFGGRGARGPRAHEPANAIL